MLDDKNGNNGFSIKENQFWLLTSLDNVAKPIELRNSILIVQNLSQQFHITKCAWCDHGLQIQRKLEDDVLLALICLWWSWRVQLQSEILVAWLIGQTPFQEEHFGVVPKFFTKYLNLEKTCRNTYYHHRGKRTYHYHSLHGKKEHIPPWHCQIPTIYHCTPHSWTVPAASPGHPGVLVSPPGRHQQQLCVRVTPEEESGKVGCNWNDMETNMFGKAG